MRRLSCLTVALLAFLFLPLPLHASYEEDVEQFVASSGVPRESLSLLIIDLASGKRMASFNETAPLIPASVTKAVTIATLLEKCGPEYRYRTDVYLTGKPHHGVVDGNILIKGSGDPSLNSTADALGGDFVKEIAEALKQKGVKEIKGEIIIDSSIFPGPAVPPSWASGDLPHSYGTGCHGFNFRNNSSGKSSVKDIPALFRKYLSSALAEAGISLRGENIREEGRHLLLHHESAPMDEIMRSCMMRSDNLFAEALLRTYAHLCGKEATATEGARLELEYWKKRKLPIEGVQLFDGSGLSRSDRMTALFLGDVLQKMSDDVIYASFFPLAGQEGTLRKFLQSTTLDSYIALKTGSMSGIQCYAGYKLDDDYAPTHVVVMMANKMSDRPRLRMALQTLLLKLFSI